MTEKGRDQFLKYLQLRARGDFVKARAILKDAVDLGDSDACWHLIWILYCERKIFSLGTDDEKYMGILLKGVKLGNPCCIAFHHVFVVDTHWEDWSGEITSFPSPPSLEAEIILWQLFPELIPRTFTASELTLLEKSAKQAMLIYDPLPIIIYLEYFSRHQDMMQFVNLASVAYAIFLGNELMARFQLENKVEAWRDIWFQFESVIQQNMFHLTTDELLAIQCIIGQLTTRFQVPDENGCVFTYRRCKQRADAAILAWMGCFRRKALTGLSRDTATMIAKMVADPLKWLSKRKIH
ncbi:MAG: hypothetical protein ABIP54_00430 [Candidatus Andersenbacteria bacterium]